MTTNLSTETQEKAFNELNEPRDKKKRLEAINSLRNAFKIENPNLQMIREDDGFILRFLRGKKFDHAKAKTTLKNFHLRCSNSKVDWPEFYERIKNPALVKSAFEKGVCYPLERRAKNGCTVVVMRPGFGRCTNIVDIFVTLYLTVDKLLDIEYNQVYGIAMIVDLAHFTAEIAKQFSPTMAMRMTRIMQQEGMPARYKCLHFTNEPKLFGSVFAIVKPLIKEKLQRRIVFHGKDFKKLYDEVDRSALPLMFAGSGPEPNVEKWKETIIVQGTAL